MHCAKGGWSWLITWNTKVYGSQKISSGIDTVIDDITAKANRTLGFLKINLWVNLSTLKAKAYKGLVCFQVEYCWSVWDPPHPGTENNSSYKIERIQCCVVRWCLGWSPMCLKTSMGCMGWCTLHVEQCRIDSWLTGLFKITRELLSINSHGLLHPVMCRIHHSHLESFIPLQTSLSS